MVSFGRHAGGYCGGRHRSVGGALQDLHREFPWSHGDNGTLLIWKQTEKDFAEIAAAGLNYVRIPIGYWAIETWEGEPFLAKASWKCVISGKNGVYGGLFIVTLRYFLKAIRWARKYGLRINLDLHAVPGSQNGWNHSGKMGEVGWLHGTMGYANAQRSLDYIRILAEFISQPQYKNVVTMFGIINEPVSSAVGPDNLRSL